MYDGTVNKAPCTRGILVDGGASCSFIDASFARTLNCEQWQLPSPLIVRTANGGKVTCSHIVAAADISIEGYVGRHDLIVMPQLDEFDVVLGRTFLASSKAVVHHEHGTISWPDEPCSVSSSTTSDTETLDTNPWHVLSPEDDEAQSFNTTASGENIQQSSHTVPDKQHTQHAKRHGRDVIDVNGIDKSPPSQPPNHVPASTPSISFPDAAIEALERVRKRVAEYEHRMKPNEGKLPPSRGQFDHKIELKDPNTAPFKGRAIPLNAEERVQLALDIRELEEAGLIVRSESEWASPAFYVSKDGGAARRLVIDYRGLNKLLKRNAMTLPHIDELLARLGKAKFFTKIDLRSSYHQVLVRPQDRHLTAFVTPIGHFEWRVLPFGEGNAPATFVQMMRHLVLADMTSRGVMDFVDDILVFSETEEQHVRDVSDVLDRLEKHSLFIKPSKCQWMVREVEFLGYTITATNEGTTIKPMRSKVEAITEWQLPRTQTQLRSFTGFANTFRSFVDGFSDIAAPLFDLLKGLPRRTSPLRWTERARNAFDQIRAAIANSTTLTVADVNKPFFVHTDASDFAVGAVLSQQDDNGEMRPIGFVSEKLNDVQYRWSVYDKELYSIVVALKHWRMHLMYAKHPVHVMNDHASLRFLLDQPKLTAKQTRWMALFSTYSELKFVHVKGSDNVRADALSRRADHDVGVAERQRIRSDIAKQQFVQVFGRLGLPNVRLNNLVVETSVGKSDIVDAIVSGYARDSHCTKILNSPERFGYHLRWDLLERDDDGSILVPNSAEIKTRILRCIHDAPASGHLGIGKTYDRLAASYHWPNQWLDVAEYVRSCSTCQQSKQRSGKPPGLLQPIEITPKAHTIALDFLGPLNRTARGKNSVAVIMDSFTKRVFLEAVNVNVTAEQTADIIINRVVRHQGLPRCIRSDRDSRFTSDIWSSIWSKLGSTIKLTTSHNHQANGLPERFMSTLLESIRSYCNDRGSDWDLYLPCIEFAYNSAKHASTGFSPIELDIGITPRMPVQISRPEHSHVSYDGIQLLQRINTNEIEAFKKMLVAQERDKNAFDGKHKDEIYSVGEMVLLDTGDLHSMNLPGGKKLRPRWAGPFEVVDVKGNLNVQLELPGHWKIHDIVHVSRLKRAHIRDLNRFPVVPDTRPVVSKTDNRDEDLGDYSEDGAAIAQVEREVNSVRPRTRAAVQYHHDQGGIHDFVELRSMQH